MELLDLFNRRDNIWIAKADSQVYLSNMYEGANELQIPLEYKEKIIGVEKYCTKPELEMLLIISEGLTKEFAKVKSKEKAKNFAKMNTIWQNCLNSKFGTL